MLNKLKNIIYLVSFIVFTFLTINHYFSEKNIIYVNKSRSSYALTVNNNLPLLKNDTGDIIVYNDGLEKFKKKRKKRFWEKLISNEKH